MVFFVKSTGLVEESNNVLRLKGIKQNKVVQIQRKFWLEKTKRRLAKK